MNVLSPHVMVSWTFTIGMGDIGFPNGTTTVYIVGEPKLTALGMITMKLKMGKKLECTFVQDPTTTAPPITTTTTTANASQAFEEMAITERRLDSTITVPLRCTDQGEMDDDDIEEVLESFYRDRAEPYTTTTTTTAAPKTTSA